MLKWFLRDRSLKVDEAVEKLRKVTAWRQQVRPDALSEDDVFHQISTGKGYIHDHLDLAGRPVVVVRVAKHFPGESDICLLVAYMHKVYTHILTLDYKKVCALSS